MNLHPFTKQRVLGLIAMQRQELLTRTRHDYVISHAIDQWRLSTITYRFIVHRRHNFSFKKAPVNPSVYVTSRNFAEIIYTFDLQ